MAITLRSGLGRKLTIAEMDENFTFLSGSYVVNSVTASMTAGSASVATRANGLAPTVTASFADTTTSASIATTAQTSSVATRANTLAPTATATSASTAVLAQTASVATRANALAPTVTATSASVAARATTLSAAATASFADLASNVRNLSISGSGAISGSLLVTGSSALAIRVSGSTALTGSIFQTGSFNVTGSSMLSGSLSITGSTNIIGAVSSSDTGRFKSLGINVAPSGVAGAILATNDVVAFASSDERLKENLEPIGSAVEKVEQITGYTYNWIPMEDIHVYGDMKDIGVIAQEVEKVLPEIVSDRENGYKAIKYDKLTVVLIQAVKELSDRVKTLEEK